MPIRGRKLTHFYSGYQVIGIGVWERLAIINPVATPTQDFAPNYLEMFPETAGNLWMVHFTNGAAPSFGFPGDGQTVDALMFGVTTLATWGIPIEILHAKRNIYVRHDNAGVMNLHYTFAEMTPSDI